MQKGYLNTHPPGSCFCPEGIPDNSPAFQRWVATSGGSKVPKGRLNLCTADQPSLRDSLRFGHRVPNVETLGYYRILPSGDTSANPDEAAGEALRPGASRYCHHGARLSQPQQATTFMQQLNLSHPALHAGVAAAETAALRGGTDQCARCIPERQNALPSPQKVIILKS